ncbi:Afadin and alpha-actinin-binding-domain-containing protein [Choanephora cucurbitarum]|nr:Afadin and alpha-actinin-binding-domain-containing protein [Choanephora cucurbitarum]
MTTAEVTFDPFLGYLDPTIDDSLTDHRELREFCSPHNYDSACNYLNLLLSQQGYSTPLIFNSTEVQDKCNILNCIYDILDDRENDGKERRSLVETIQQMKRERAELENQLAQAKRNHQLAEKNYAETRTKLEVNETEQQKIRLQNQRLKEEISKVKHNLQYIKAQYANETRRHEQDMTKIQDRLLSMMNNRHQVNVTTLDMSSHFATTLDDASDNDQVVQIRKMYTNLLDQTKDREIQARKECEELRTCMIKLYTGARHLLETQIQHFEETQTKQRNTTDQVAQFRLPLDCGGQEAIERVNDLLDRLKQEWDYQITQQPQGYPEEEVTALQDQIVSLQEALTELAEEYEEAKLRHEETTKIYKRFEQGGFFDTLYPTPQAAAHMDSDDEDEDEMIIDLIDDKPEKYSVLKQKAMQEQRALSDSALALAKEREKLEAERWAFVEMRRALEAQDILNDTVPESQYTIPSSGRSSFSTSMPLRTGPYTQSIGDVNRARKRQRSFLGAPSGK